MTHAQFMQIMTRLDRTLCKLLLAVAENVPQRQDNALESTVGPVTASQGLVYWKAKLVDSRDVLETRPSREAILEYSKAQACVKELELCAGIKGE